MRVLPSLLRLAGLLCLLALNGVASADDDANRVGFVDKVENEAMVVSNEATAMALIGTAVHLKDELRTGAGGRMQVTFRDNTVLTLGENASVVVDRYVFDPDEGVGETVLQATKGAFRFASGRIKELRNNQIAVSTPVADIGVRGTEFWGGPLDNRYGVLLLRGEVSVSNQAGSVKLAAPGQGTDIPSPLEAPGPAAAWAPDKIDRAIATVTMH